MPAMKNLKDRRMPFSDLNSKIVYTEGRKPGENKEALNLVIAGGGGHNGGDTKILKTDECLSKI